MTVNLTLKPQKNIFNNIILKETIDQDIFKYLLNSSLLTNIKNPVNKIYFDTEHKQLKKYESKINKKGFIEVKYTIKSHKIGRVYTENSLGLCNFRKEIRHTLTKNIYTDIDIKNCHFVILFNLLESNKIKCKYLKKYINERDDILNKMIIYFLITKDEAKELFIKLLYFGSFKKWVDDNKFSINESDEIVIFILKFQKELIKNCEILIEHNKNIFEDIKQYKMKNNKPLDNLKSSVCSHILQEYERRILEKVFIFCCDNGYIKNNNCVLCYDGLMIETINYKEQLINELEEYIFNELHFKINFINKEMTLNYNLNELIENPYIDQQETKKEKCINITLEMVPTFDKSKADILHYFNILNINRIKDKKDLFLLGALIFSLNLGYELFYKLGCKYYSINEINRIWKAYDNKKSNYSIHSLHYWGRRDNLEKHNELQKQFNKDNKLNYLIDSTFKINDKLAFIDDDEPIEKINFESRYLLDQNKLLNDESSIFVQSVLNCKNKTILIKGPYGIGKTKFLNEYIKINPNSKILFGSYRITLTNDLKGNFTELGFKTYREDITAKRVIIQLESLLKLDNNFNLFVDEYSARIPFYDIVILDEIEGILNQLYSPTMKGQSYDIYNYLVNLNFH